ELDLLLGEIEEKRKEKEKLKQDVIPGFRNKNILFIFGETDDQSVTLWQNNLYNLAFESGVKDLSPEYSDDFFINEIKTHNLMRMDTINYKDANSLIEN